MNKIVNSLGALSLVATMATADMGFYAGGGLAYESVPDWNGASSGVGIVLRGGMNLDMVLEGFGAEVELTKSVIDPEYNWYYGNDINVLTLATYAVYSINITRVGPFPPRIADVGILTDLAVHDIDLIRFISQRDIKDKSIFKSQKIHNHYEDNAILSFSMEDDIVASITTNWLTPFKKRKIEVACKEAYYEADLMTQELLEYSNYEINNSFVTRGCFVKKSEPLLNELASFIDYVQTGNKPISATIEDSIETLQIVE